MRAGILAACIAALGLTAGQVGAASCDPGKAGHDLTHQEAEAVYQCIADGLFKGYKKGKKRWIPAEYVRDYRNWTKASAAPAAPGFHTGRFLVTWVNDAGAAEYMRYAEDPSIPVGTVIAKESFAVSDKGKVRRGPLFFMEKVASGVSPETDDWYYMMVAANGRPQAVNVVSACHECHGGNFGATGGLGYPVEDVRVSN